MKLIKKFQMGGEVAPEQMQEEQAVAAGQEQAQGGGDPMEQILGVIMQLGEAANASLQSQDPNQMAQVLQGLVQFASDLQAQMSAAEESMPVFGKGGKILRKKKMACKK